MRERRLPDGGIRHNCIAFYKGELVDDDVLIRVIEYATHGYITEAGMNLYLIPVKVYEQAKRDAIERVKPEDKNKEPWPSVRKTDCIPLTSFLPENYCVTKPRNRRTHDSKVLMPRPLEGTNRNACTLAQVTVNRNANCPSCGSSLSKKRRDAKYCSSKCRQVAYRSRSHV